MLNEAEFAVAVPETTVAYEGRRKVAVFCAVDKGENEGGPPLPE